MVDYDSIYPKVPTAPMTEPRIQTGENFRLHKVNTVLSQLESEHKHYEKVRKKYNRARSFFHGTAVATASSSALFTVSGIGTSITGPGIIVGIPLSAVGGFLGIVSASCGIATKKLTIKVSKHEKTIQLIKSKKNSINDMVSKALSDGKIDEKEFTFIIAEFDKYEEMKSRIREKHIKKNISTPNIQSLKEEMRMELKKELVDQLVNPKK
jgi:hypothetical protein